MIKNIYNGKIYIGSTGDLYHRLTNHRSALLKNRHPNKHLQKSINKYGLDCFEFKVLKVIVLKDDSILMNTEQEYINLFKPEYNKQPFAYLNRGYRHTKEAIEKIRISGIGRKTNNREILQFDLNGNFIKEWNSIIEIKKSFNINHTNMGLVCRHYESKGFSYPLRKSSCGYIWKYKKERNGVL